VVTSPLAGNVPRHTDATQRTKGISPGALIRKRVLAVDAPYNATQRLIAVVIAERVNGEDGCAFMSQRDIAVRAGLSVRAVRQNLPAIVQGEHPLFAVSYPGETRGFKHRTPRYTVVSNVSAFVIARDKLAVERDERAVVILGGQRRDRTAILKPEHQELRDEFHRGKIDLQRRLIDETISEREYFRRLRALAVDVLTRSGVPRTRAESEVKRYLESTGTPAPGAY